MFKLSASHAMGSVLSTFFLCCILVVGLLSTTVLAGSNNSNSAREGTAKSTICHYDGGGRVHILTISEDAFDKHVSQHGDHALITYYEDEDNDGFGLNGSTVERCTLPDGYAETSEDCDGTDPTINPGATEICDGIDNNCDSLVDEGFDTDGDGFTSCSGDCNDGDAGINPGTTETCDGIDNDCDGLVDEGFDTDGDRCDTLDNRVFNEKISPDEFFTNEPSTTTISAEILSGNLPLSSVIAYRTDANGNLLYKLGQMYDDGTHGDLREADTIFTAQFDVNEPAAQTIFVRVSATYLGEQNSYLSSVMQITIYDPLPEGASAEVAAVLSRLEQNFFDYIESMDIPSATQHVLDDALSDPAIAHAEQSGNTISITFTNGIRGVVILNDPNNPVNSPGSAIPTLPNNAKFPGSDKVLIFAPYYGWGIGADPHYNSDDAMDYFSDSVYMQFSPSPPVITKNEAASLDLVKTWGNYGAVIVDTHGGTWSGNVFLCTGTEATDANQITYELDLLSKRIIQSSGGNYCFLPSFITKYSVSMKNTFFWLGSCKGLANDTMWNELRKKGAKVAFGWTDSVRVVFDNARFEEVFDLMLPDSDSVDPVTAKAAFDAVPNKIDNGPCIFGWCTGGTGATLKLKTSGPDWENFVFVEGGIVNGDFETGDWTGWNHGGDYDFRLITGARKHGGTKSAALGRWDTVFNGSDPTSEPYGYEWFYQDFIVPNNVTYLKFYWWMETYDTAAWDWFDAYLEDEHGNALITILRRAGKPGSDYGPYWSTQMADGGDGWREVQVDISAYQGQKVRIYFGQHLDGYGDQQRVYVDDVILE